MTEVPMAMAIFNACKIAAYRAGFAAGVQAERARIIVEWQPIETAPKDTARGDFLITLFNSNGDCCWVQIVRNPRNHHGISIASHWMPLPEPPALADHLEHQTTTVGRIAERIRALPDREPGR